MLRGLLLVLLLANLAFFVWSQGSFGATGGGVAGGEHEPERLARQVRPEAVQLLIPATPPTPPVAASSAAPQASAASAAASAAEAASAPSGTASEVASAAASSPATVDAITSAATLASAASAAAAASAAGAAIVAVAVPAPPAPPGTRCVEAGPFSGAELAAAETALAANAKTRRIARRWVQVAPDAASAPTPTSPQHRLRIDATPGEVAVLESLPASVVGRSFAPCTAR